MIDFCCNSGIKKIYLSQLKVFETRHKDELLSLQVDFKAPHFQTFLRQQQQKAKSKGLSFHIPNTDTTYVCKEPSPIIHTNGDVFFCYAHENQPIGNVNNSFLKEWNDQWDYAQKNRKKFCAECVKYPPKVFKPPKAYST